MGRPAGVIGLWPHLEVGERVVLTKGPAKDCRGEVTKLDGMGGKQGFFVRVRLDGGQPERGEAVIAETWLQREDDVG